MLALITSYHFICTSSSCLQRTVLDDAGVLVDLQAAHAVVDHRSDDRHVEVVRRLHRIVVEVLLAPRVPGLAAAVPPACPCVDDPRLLRDRT